jgi:hypothetical protein
MTIPTIASGITAVVSLYLVFHKDISSDFHSSVELDENSFLKDKNGVMSTILYKLICRRHIWYCLHGCLLVVPCDIVLDRIIHLVYNCNFWRAYACERSL